MGTTTRTMISLRAALLVGGAVLGSFFLGVLAVRADGMVLTARAPGGPTRGALSFAGTLTGSVPERPVLIFEFKRGAMGGRACGPVSTEPVVVDSNGAFSTEVNIGACPTDLFDGQDVVVDIRLGDKLLAGNQPIHPVPYAKYADQAGSPDCPAGYERESQKSLTDVRGAYPLRRIVCKRLVGAYVDEMVRVGAGQAAFWIDRHEALIVQEDMNTHMQLPLGQGPKEAYPTYPTAFPENGQWTPSSKVLFYALSTPGVNPSRSPSWFQANLACRLSGKRLPTGNEWLSAAMGTPDPGGGASESDEVCRITSSMGARRSRAPGDPAGCMSEWGAYDMIGNLWEWTGEWYAGLSDTKTEDKWPGGYLDDATYNIGGRTLAIQGTAPTALPAAAIRGGGWQTGVGAGIFSITMAHAPSNRDNLVGFRCVIPR